MANENPNTAVAVRNNQAGLQRQTEEARLTDMILGMTDWDTQMLHLVRTQVAPNAPLQDILRFGIVCKSTGLSPVTQPPQIYLIPYGGKWQVQAGIDGYRLAAQRSGAFAGMDDPVFEPAHADIPEKATVTVYRIVQGHRCAFTASARWKEFARLRNGVPQNLWASMPHHMLAKCAQAQALRAAFPQELAAVQLSAYDDPREQPEVAQLMETGPVRRPGLPLSLADEEPVVSRHALTDEQRDAIAAISATEREEDAKALWPAYAQRHGLVGPAKAAAREADPVYQALVAHARELAAAEAEANANAESVAPEPPAEAPEELPF